MNQNEFEKLLRSKVHADASIAAVTMPRSGGTAYMRQPTAAEYMSTAEDRNRFEDYVRECFMGAIVGEKEIDFAEVEKREGPAFVRGGALGLALNKLAGTGEAATRFF